ERWAARPELVGGALARRCHIWDICFVITMTEQHGKHVAMGEHDWIAQQFEAERSNLRAVAYRILGAARWPDGAVQEAWLRLWRCDADSIDNLGGCLTTVVARVLPDTLRPLTSRREESLAEHNSAPAAPRDPANDPEQEALLADSVGL